ncbi:Smr/MutS family protein [Candidatus Uhrbacteria bacterium]|nr:Smr/MutS family protein [Candidatus Uhrbacteria bacterium]
MLKRGVLRPPLKDPLAGAELDPNLPAVDLHGLSSDQALCELDAFLHRAYVGGIPAARIIYGRGTGRLLAAVSHFLRTHPLVEYARGSDQPAEIGGVTYVLLVRAFPESLH